MTTTNNPAGQPAYTAAQYEERIERLYTILDDYEWHARPGFPGIRECRWCWQSEGEGHASRCRVAEVLSTERAHRTAERIGLTCKHHDESYDCGACVGESDIEQRRRGV